MEKTVKKYWQTLNVYVCNNVATLVNMMSMLNKCNLVTFDSALKFNSLSANPTKWSNTLKQSVDAG